MAIIPFARKLRHLASEFARIAVNAGIFAVNALLNCRIHDETAETCLLGFMQKLIPIIAWAESIVPIWEHGVFVKVQLGISLSVILMPMSYRLVVSMHFTRKPVRVRVWPMSLTMVG
jgi:hypothetical protein